jgi:hypothetical protein
MHYTQVRTASPLCEVTWKSCHVRPSTKHFFFRNPNWTGRRRTRKSWRKCSLDRTGLWLEPILRSWIIRWEATWRRNMLCGNGPFQWLFLQPFFHISFHSLPSIHFIFSFFVFNLLSIFFSCSCPVYYKFFSLLFFLPFLVPYFLLIIFLVSLPSFLSPSHLHFFPLLTLPVLHLHLLFLLPFLTYPTLFSFTRWQVRKKGKVIPVTGRGGQ